MVGNHNGYKKSKETFLVGLQKRRKPNMNGSSHEDKEYLEVWLAWLEKIISTP